MIAGGDEDFSAIRTPLQEHLAFGDDQPGVMLSGFQTQGRAFDNRVRFRRGEGQRMIPGLLDNLRGQGAVLQIQARRAAGGWSGQDTVPADIHPSAVLQDEDDAAGCAHGFEFAQLD